MPDLRNVKRENTGNTACLELAAVKTKPLDQKVFQIVVTKHKLC